MRWNYRQWQKRLLFECLAAFNLIRDFCGAGYELEHFMNIPRYQSPLDVAIESIMTHVATIGLAA
jgi:hypothetical protein